MELAQSRQANIVYGEPQYSLSEEESLEFAGRGLIKVKHAFSPEMAGQIQAELWRRFAKWGIERNQPKSWETLDEKSFANMLKSTRRVSGLQNIYNEKIDEIARLLSHEEQPEKVKALLLLTFSGQHEYIGHERVPRRMWHSDTPNLPGAGVSGVIVLGFINEVLPKGGGTMVIAGSHRLFAASESAISSKMAKRKLKRHAYFKRLFSKEPIDRSIFLKESGYVEGVELQVEELTGEPGDAYFVNGSLLHTICPNFHDEPRMMVRGFYGTSKLRDYYEEKFGTKSAAESVGMR